jgi:hypothetical protein
MSAFLRAALDRARAVILAAPNGAQETTLHREAYSIGGLIGPNLSEGEAFAALHSAAKAMPAYGEPWRNIERKLRHPSVAAWKDRDGCQTRLMEGKRRHLSGLRAPAAAASHCGARRFQSTARRPITTSQRAALPRLIPGRCAISPP